MNEVSSLLAGQASLRARLIISVALGKSQIELHFVIVCFFSLFFSFPLISFFFGLLFLISFLTAISLTFDQVINYFIEWCLFD